MAEDSAGADRGGFSAETARRALTAASAETGLEVEGATLLRLGENAIYRLPSAPLMARIARTNEYLPDVRTEVAAARWLESAGFPAVRLAGPAARPVVADGRVVTFWELLGDRTVFGTLAELAVLHDLIPPSSLALPKSPAWRPGLRRKVYGHPPWTRAVDP